LIIFTITSLSNNNNNHHCSYGLTIVESWTEALVDSEAFMTWQMATNQYTMFIDRAIKSAIEQRLPTALRRVLGAPFDASRFDLVVHPGGPSILRSVAKCLSLDGVCLFVCVCFGLQRCFDFDICLRVETALQESWTVLRQFGNMSSPTVFYVLDEYLRNRKQKKENLLLIAFGLVFCVLLLLPIRSSLSK
jgi:predicted naringenin-chalcone synthase